MKVIWHKSPEEPAEVFEGVRSGQDWRIVADAFAIQLAPVCARLAAPVSSMPSGDQLEIWPVLWSVSNTAPPPRFQLAPEEFLLLLNCTDDLNWPEPHVPREHLPSICFKAEFRLDKTITPIYLSGCEKTLLSEVEMRQMPAFRGEQGQLAAKNDVPVASLSEAFKDLEKTVRQQTKMMKSAAAMATKPISRKDAAERLKINQRSTLPRYCKALRLDPDKLTETDLPKLQKHREKVRSRPHLKRFNKKQRGPRMAY